jgi:hypothetical protein
MGDHKTAYSPSNIKARAAVPGRRKTKDLVVGKEDHDNASNTRARAAMSGQRKTKGLGGCE